MWPTNILVNLSFLCLVTIFLPNDELLVKNLFSVQKNSGGICVVDAFVIINPSSSSSSLTEKKQPFTKADWAHEDSYDYFALEDSTENPTKSPNNETKSGDLHEIKSRSSVNDLLLNQPPLDDDVNNEIESASSAQGPGIFLLPQLFPPPPLHQPHGINHLEKVGEKLNHFLNHLGGTVFKHMHHVNASLGVLNTGIAVGANGLQHFITNFSAKKLSTIQLVLDRIGYFFHSAITRIRTIFDTLRAGIHNLIQSVIGPGHGHGHKSDGLPPLVPPPPPPSPVIEKVVEPVYPIQLEHPPSVQYGTIELDQPIIQYSNNPLDE